MLLKCITGQWERGREGRLGGGAHVDSEAGSLFKSHNATAVSAKTLRRTCPSRSSAVAPHRTFRAEANSILSQDNCEQGRQGDSGCVLTRRLR